MTTYRDHVYHRKWCPVCQRVTTHEDTSCLDDRHEERERELREQIERGIDLPEWVSEIL